MSIDTTLARGLAAETDRAWREHRTRGCAQCSEASRTRKWAQLCDRGAGLRTDAADAQRQLAYQRALDKQPITGQAHLF